MIQLAINQLLKSYLSLSAFINNRHSCSDKNGTFLVVANQKFFSTINFISLGVIEIWSSII